MISNERQAELEQFSIRVYQQLQAGYPIDSIRSQFDSIEGADPTEVRWVMDKGRERYLGYYAYYRKTHREEAKWTAFGSATLLLVILLILSNLGWPEHGRGRSLALIGMLTGLGGIGWGLWSWFAADLKGRRLDVDQL